MDLKQVLHITPRTLNVLNKKDDENLVDIEQSKEIFDLFDKVSIKYNRKDFIKNLKNWTSHQGWRRFYSNTGTRNGHESSGMLSEGDGYCGDGRYGGGNQF